MMQLDSIDKLIINHFQDGFPLVSHPYKLIAEQFSITEDEVIQRLQHLQQNKVVSRIGTVFTPNTIGASTLCAMAVPTDRLDEIAHIINRHDEVNHNYQRSHDYNLWFVVTAQNQNHLNDILASISNETGLVIMNLPLETAYYLNLGFNID